MKSTLFPLAAYATVGEWPIFVNTIAADSTMAKVLFTNLFLFTNDFLQFTILYYIYVRLYT
ncbi:hypothetical protein CLOBOL_00417 [Enterocloster bolteae ATCC BAA-613]|uniref:Uncharacterized protein n=1 Tax=Enterocloster bolteae (strain ATCC BAA-613 / DSM 15670 / CCUG 46953 / JCM 12243 / WAL 16351) TaxID=411902 RepID=A8RHH2_ENTBW|nr:hypothetical protein CLOBOL_00417 [Enterocloster bolteae ATCC BAA-613]